MEEKIYIKNISLGGILYGLGLTSDDLYAEIGISKERFVELLSRDLYCPTLEAAPTSALLTYTDTDGNEHHFRAGQPCRWADADGAWRMAVCLDITETATEWYVLPVALSELENDADLATNASVDSKVAAAESSLTESINTVESELTASINTVDSELTESINTVNTNLGNRITSVNSTLTTTINTVKTNLEASMATHEETVDAAMTAHKEEVDTELHDMQVEFETLITEHRDYMYGKLDEMQVTVDETNAAATEAERVSYAAQTAAAQASTDAAAAVAAVATLEGLADTTTAQETLAAQVAQIEANKQNILVVPNFELVRETGYDL